MRIVGIHEYELEVPRFQLNIVQHGLGQQFRAGGANHHLDTVRSDTRVLVLGRVKAHSIRDRAIPITAGRHAQR